MTQTCEASEGRSARAQYDAFYTARARTDLVTRLYREAMEKDYPSEVGAFSSCDWPLLGLMTARLRMRPGQMLVDAGCGTGGIGLWLARALDARLLGFDISPAAVAQATDRGRTFSFTPGRAAFRVGALERSGLPGDCADGIVCVDALSRADRAAAFREFARIMAPDGRLVITRALRRGTAPAWEDAHAAGLAVEDLDERPDEPAMWERLYQLWIAYADDLRRELGQTQAQRMLDEARRVLPMLPGRRAVLVTLRRSEPPGPVDTMGRFGCRPGGWTTTNERTPQ
ncbi:class I SAM-dependent methyltransferase [Streptomyces sp. NPDC056160]|uniref:class I SAM-dependent methyltransferase n=1 Tax=Streptomyces sp. NPDC056160 TaxID=3345731 RepID=UPI0035DA8C23